MFSLERLHKPGLRFAQEGELLDDLLDIKLFDGNVHHPIVDALEIAHPQIEQLDIDGAQWSVNPGYELLERQVEIRFDGTHLVEHRHKDYTQPQIGDLCREVV